MRHGTQEATVRWGLGSYCLRLEQPIRRALHGARPGAEQQLGILLQLIASNSRFAADVGRLLQLARPAGQGPALARHLWRTPLQQLLASGRLRLTFTAIMPSLNLLPAPSAGPERAAESSGEVPPMPSAHNNEAGPTTILRLFYGVECRLYEGDVALVGVRNKKGTPGATARPHDGVIDEAQCRPRGLTHWHLRKFIQAARQQRLAEFTFA